MKIGNPTAIDETDEQPCQMIYLALKTMNLLKKTKILLYGIKDLVDDDNFGVIGKFMDQRFGMREEDHKREKIVDAYVNHMRKFNFGQSVTTIGELSYLNAAKRDDNTERLNTAASAYELFDNMKGAFSGGTSLNEKARCGKRLR